VQALGDWAFRNADQIRLEIVVAIGNHPGRRVADEVGAVREGTLYRRRIVRDRVFDASMFSITRALEEVSALPGENWR